MTPPEDESLREAFRVMARHDARRTPEFQALRARVLPRSAWRLAAPVGSALALAACLLLGVRSTLSKRDAAPSSDLAPAAAPVATTEAVRVPPSEPSATVEAPPAIAELVERRRELGLGAAQLATLHALAREGHAERAAVERKRALLQERLATALGTRPLDPAEATRLGIEIRSLDAQLEALERGHWARAQEVLTARQRQLLASAPSRTDAGASADGGP